jgi:Ni/Co efflux regulator RcnB
MKRLLTAALALSLVAGTTAMAQPGYGDHRDDHGRNDQSRYDQGRGHQNHWARGQRLPRNYYQDRSHYVDYRTHHLRRPPAGYRWVRTDDSNYAMVAIASGLIASIIAGNR